MKCICGYEVEENLSLNEREKAGKERFISLNFSNGFYINGRYKLYRLKACPKCKTVKIDEGELE